MGDEARWVKQPLDNKGPVKHEWKKRTLRVARSIQPQSLMRWSCRNGLLEVAQILNFMGTELNVPMYKCDWQPIHFACQAGQLKVVQWLHSQGAALDVMTDGYSQHGANPDGYSPQG